MFFLQIISIPFSMGSCVPGFILHFYFTYLFFLAFEEGAHNHQLAKMISIKNVETQKTQKKLVQKWGLEVRIVFIQCGIRSTFLEMKITWLDRAQPLPHTFVFFHSFSTFQFFSSFNWRCLKRQKKSGNCNLSGTRDNNDMAIIFSLYALLLWLADFKKEGGH